MWFNVACLFTVAVSTSRSDKSTSSFKKIMKKKKRVLVPLQCLERAIQQCERYLHEKEHDDIDVMADVSPHQVVVVYHCLLSRHNTVARGSILQCNHSYVHMLHL